MPKVTLCKKNKGLCTGAPFRECMEHKQDRLGVLKSYYNGTVMRMNEPDRCVPVVLSETT